jgi:uncharacterized membrane protein YdjX (TVP38/TMEM64 family)
MITNFKKGLISAIIIALFIGLIYYSGLGSYFTLENMQKKSIYLKEAVEHHYMRSVLFYIVGFAFLILITLPVVGPLTMLGGYLFGVFFGFLYALIAAVLGAILSFLVIRYLLSSMLRERYKARLEPFRQKMQKYGASYLLMLNLLSIIPYVAINILAALTGVPLFTAFWVTILGSIPLIFIYALAGQQLSTISSASDIFSPQIIILLIILALVALLPLIVKKFKKDID